MELTLWSWELSPFAGKVRAALAYKQIEHRTVEIDPRKRPARLRELNPNNRVPVLEVDGVGLRESNNICQFLEEAFPERPLWPADPVRRAYGRGLLSLVDDELTIPFFLAGRKQAFGLDEFDHPEAVAHLHGRLTRNWKKFEPLLQADWLLGDTPTLADLAALPLAVRIEQWNRRLAPSAEEFPKVAAWLGRLRAHPLAAEVSRRGEAESA